MSSPNDSGAPAPDAPDGAPDAPTESEADGEVTELFTMTDTGLYKVSAAILPGASSVSCLECFPLPHLRCRILTGDSFALRRLFPRLFCVGRFLSQESKKTTVEKVRFHSGGSSAAYFKTAPRGVAHVRYLAENAVKTFWKDSPTTWDKPKSNIGPVAVPIRGRNILHVGSFRRCLAPLVCSGMDAGLSGLSHTEVDFDRPEWVSAKRDVVAESSPEHLVKVRTLVRCIFCPSENEFCTSCYFDVLLIFSFTFF